ncbi:hypothetical protein PMIN06_006773 [Paraphaeosphaeria minitans]|uniref:Uncharacterized protein n=1 Tax=Paraphaeosphaeria minitans TaxID=565426 RepID=A0A9P6KR07_9PLEO|nr:hypothetical protein PMIN01_05612 [Paraphaeosphaeria minitans]
MATPSHLASVLRSGREAQSRRKSAAVPPDEVAPDEYPTFTRPISPELDESKRYTQDPPKRKRTNPWSFHRNSNSSESGDDCDRPLSRKLSRKASNVFHIFTPQRTRSNASAAPAQHPREAPDDGEADEHVQPTAKRRHVTAERRKSSLKQLIEFIWGKRKDSATSEKPLLPAPLLDEDDLATGLWKRSSPNHPQSPFNSDPDDIIYMSGALPASTPNRTSPVDLGGISLDPLVNPNVTESKRRKAFAAAASIDSNEPSMLQGVGSSVTGYSPPPTPKNKRSVHYPNTAMVNFHPCHSSLRRPRAGPSSIANATYMDVTVAHASARYAIAPWEEADATSPSTSTIGVLPSLSSVDSTSNLSLPTFAQPPTTASPTTVALHTPSRPHSPAQARSGAPLMDFPTTTSIDPAHLTNARPATLSLPSPSLATRALIPGSSIPGSSPAAPYPHAHADHLLAVPAADGNSRPSTAADSVDEAGLRLRRSGSLRREAWRLEGMEGFEFVERAVGWGAEEGARERSSSPSPSPSPV